MDLACCELTAPIIERRDVSSLWEDLSSELNESFWRPIYRFHRTLEGQGTHQPHTEGPKHSICRRGAAKGRAEGEGRPSPAGLRLCFLSEMRPRRGLAL